jgi:hypothetical protein
MTAERENLAPYAVTALGWWRTDVPAAVNDAYWRDIHGTLAARIPGFAQYRQLHLGTLTRGWRFTDGIDTTAPGEPAQGIAQMMFRTAEDLAAFGAHPFVTTHVFHDERNLARRNVTVHSAPGRARTHLDRTDDPTPQGTPAYPTYAIMLRQQDGVDRVEFHAYTGELARRWSERTGVLRLRFTPLEPYDPDGWQSPGVRHDWASDEQYQAWVEIVVTDNGTLDALPPLDAAVVRGVHVYSVREKYTIVYGGRPTDVGLRGWPAVQTIAQAGAANQQTPELLRALYGAVVDGVDVGNDDELRSR